MGKSRDLPLSQTLNLDPYTGVKNFDPCTGVKNLDPYTGVKNLAKTLVQAEVC
jgi:hypothetical protein